MIVNKGRWPLLSLVSHTAVVLLRKIAFELSLLILKVVTRLNPCFNGLCLSHLVLELQVLGRFDHSVIMLVKLVGLLGFCLL